MSSEHPTAPDLLKPSELPSSTSAPFGLEGDEGELAPAPVLAESAVVEVEPPIPDSPTLHDLFVEQRRLDRNTRQVLLGAIGQVREELRNATANVGDTHGSRLDELERQMRQLLGSRANGSTNYAG